MRITDLRLGVSSLLLLPDLQLLLCHSYSLRIQAQIPWFDVPEKLQTHRKGSKKLQEALLVMPTETQAILRRLATSQQL